MNHIATLSASTHNGAPQLQALTPQQQHQLDTFGFLHFKQVFSGETAQQIISQCDALMAIEGDNGGHEVHTEAGTMRLSNLVEKADAFRIVLNEEAVLSAIFHVLGDDVKLSSLNARFAKPGEGHQALHTDGAYPEHAPAVPDTFYVCNSLWVLEDISPANGATRIIPGSHRSRLGPADVMDDPSADHPAQLIVSAQAGDVIVFNSHLWHGGTCNNSKLPRKCMHGYFTRRDCPQQTDQRKWLSPETIQRLSPWERYLCDVASA